VERAGREVLNAVACSFARRALAALGAEIPQGLPVHHRRLLRRLEVLAQQPLETGEGVEGLRQLPPALAPHGTLLARCGEALVPVLRGELDPVEVLFPGGDDSLVAALYQEPMATAWNRRLARGLRQLVPAEGPPLRILEVGAGTGATSRLALEVLPPGRFTYHLTDVSPHLLRRSAAALAREGVEVAPLDLEASPFGQGFTGGTFDVVVAAHVLHAVRDLPRALEHIAQLLRPGGTLLLLETVEAQPWLDVTFGLTEGWWRFADPRRDHPLLDLDGWRRTLREAGFGELAAAPPEGPFEGSGMGLVAARATGREAVGDWWLVTSDLERGRALREALGVLRDRCSVMTTAQLAGLEHPPRGCLYLDRLDGAGPAGSGTAPDGLEGSAGLLELARTLDRLAPPEPFRLFVITRGGVPPSVPSCIPSTDAREPLSIAAAAVVGLAAGMDLEYPRWGCRRIDVDARPGWAEAVAREVLQGTGEEQVVLRGGHRRVPRLVAAVETQPAENAPQLRPDGHYLITGGLGGLGLALARWLVERGVRYLSVLGRRGRRQRRDDPAVRAVLQGLEAAGARVEVHGADVAERPQLAAVLEQIANGPAPLHGIFHLAGVGGATPLAELHPEALRDTLRPKVTGAWHLHELCGELGLAPEIFVAFSSAAAIWGARHQAAYGAANRSLDQLIHWRRRQGLPGLSLNWGYLEAGAMVTAEDRRWYQELGLEALDTAAAFDRMLALLRSGTAQATVARVDWRRFNAVYQAGTERRLLRRLDGPPAPGPPAKPPERSASEVDSLPTLRGLLAESLGLPEGELRDEIPLQEQGFDSLVAVELSNRLQRRLGLEVAVSRLLGDGSLGGLIARLEAMVGDGPSAAAASGAVKAPAGIVEGTL
jgi:NAD(P)-dependent dehydrogenase (short-subunit alcohol dehydrogenase family)/SAM-dependent methyltransferase/acyl carrier protein